MDLGLRILELQKSEESEDGSQKTEVRSQKVEGKRPVMIFAMSTSRRDRCFSPIVVSRYFLFTSNN